MFTQNAYKILSMFSLSPGSNFNRKEIKKATRLNNVPLDNALSSLASSGILKRKGILYSLDFEFHATQVILSLISRERLKMKDLPLNVYLVMVDIASFFSAYRNVHAYLFGSYSKLIYTDKSDIDIAVIAGEYFDKKSFQKRLERVEATYGKSVEVHYFDKSTFYKNKKDPMVRDILKNGMPLF